MEKILCLLGKTASGKTTIAKELIDHYGFNNFISYTTRPMRDGEKNGVDYNFVNDYQFDKLNGKIDEREYKVFDGSIWRYSHVNDINDNERYVAIVDKKGLEDFLAFYGASNVFAVYVNCDDGAREFRYTERQKNDKDHDAIKKEWERRNTDDNIVFDGIENKVNLCVNNNGVSKLNENSNIDSLCKIIVNHFNYWFNLTTAHKKTDVVEQYSLFIREMLNDGRIEQSDAKTLSTIFKKMIDLVDYSLG